MIFKNPNYPKFMKKQLITAVLLLMSMATQAQNVQLHYDFGRFIYPDEEAGRQKVTMTLEQFKADKWGSWFYFVDIDFSRKFTEGAYTEISREFNLSKKLPIAAHVEYNGGLNRFGSFQQAALLGTAYNGHNADFSKTWSVQLMYKRFFKSYEYTRGYNSIQLTGVWGLRQQSRYVLRLHRLLARRESQRSRSARSAHRASAVVQRDAAFQPRYRD